MQPKTETNLDSHMTQSFQAKLLDADPAGSNPHSLDMSGASGIPQSESGIWPHGLQPSRSQDDVKVKEMIATAKAVLGYDILEAPGAHPKRWAWQTFLFRDLANPILLFSIHIYINMPTFVTYVNSISYMYV